MCRLIAQCAYVLREFDRSVSAVCPAVALLCRIAVFLTPGKQRFDFLRGIGRELVNRHKERHAEFLDAFDMLGKVLCAFQHCLNVLFLQVFRIDAAVHLERTYGCDDNDRIRCESAKTALDVEELLRAKICAEAGLRDNVIRKLEGGAGCDQGVTAMGDIRERSAMHEYRRMFEGLYKVRLNRILHDDSCRAVGFDIPDGDRLVVIGVGNDTAGNTLAEILEVL